MNNQNDAWMVPFILYGTALFAVVMVIAIAGAFLAAGAVVIFCINEWYKIFRYEGYQPIMWLGGITAFASLIGISEAATQLEIASQLQARNRPSGDHVIGAFLSILAISIPTAGYWVYRLVKPISHFRIATIDQFHVQYQQGDLTRTERDAYIKEIISMGDEELEQQIAQARRKPKAAPIMIDDTAPVGPAPANDASSPINHGSNPRRAFDIPQQRADR